MKSTFNDESKNAAVDEVAKACESVTDENRCEYGYKLGVCYKETGEKHGLDFDEVHKK